VFITKLQELWAELDEQDGSVKIKEVLQLLVVY